MAQGEAPSAAGLGWAGLRNGGPRVGHTSTPSAWGTAMASWPLATHWGCNSPFVELRRSRKLGGYRG